ncbi:MAG: winged helix-turn-helix transcriptional regulator [Ktedonobacteraceae bacterium]|nr:winged helix-turn-helix transcriptional regulator [Ktedonobacteraceae bacterium]
MLSANETIGVRTPPSNSKITMDREDMLFDEPTKCAPKFLPPLTNEEALMQARLLKALADPTRLRILSLLSRHQEQVCVYDIVATCRQEQPTISHHLRILREVGLVDFNKKGLWAYYYICHEVLDRVREMITDLA